MTARFWLWTLTMMACLGIGAAWADQREVRVLGQDLPLPGTSLEDIRVMKLAKGQRLVCESDTDKPRLARPGLMEQQRGRTADHLRRCSIFADGGDNSWTQANIATAFGPARLWLIFVEQGANGRYRLAQFSLWSKRDNWDKAAGLLKSILGEPATLAERYLGWQDEQHETQMFIDEKNPDEFAVAIGDQRLRKLMK
ncbi:MAG: hypothetical protein HY055_13335, partial [Magnetospirillum sp.]|nr:hypothetical protein [Magnetospirillum sp.]